MFVFYGYPIVLWLIFSSSHHSITPTLPRDDWYRLEILNRHVGWMRLLAESATFDGHPAVRVRSELAIHLLRSGTPLSLTRTRVVYFRPEPPFAPLHFEMTSNESGAERLVEGPVRDGKALLTTLLDGRTTQEEVTLPPSTLFEEAIPFAFRAQALRVGETAKFSVFNGEFFRPMDDTVSVLRSEPLTLDGRQMETLVVRHRLDWMNGIETTEWLDDDGAMAQTEMNTLGVPLRLVRSEASEATRVGGYQDVDVILTTRVLVQGGVPADSEEMRLRLKLPDGDLRETLPETSRQSLSLDVLTVCRDIPPENPLPFPVSDASVETFLKPTVYVESGDPEIQAKAKEIVTDAQDAWDAASRINQWVHAYVTDKNLKTGFATARQTLDSRSGDCTEHTVLGVALSRAAGIPARLCAGLVWQRDALFYHFWFEVYVGKWIALDPTLGQTPADARRIQFSGGNLESNTVLELGEGILRTLNRLEVELQK